jgi:molybdopterin synthase catalytic subunit
VLAADTSVTWAGAEVRRMPIQPADVLQFVVDADKVAEQYALDGLLIVHRVGTMVPGEPIVFVATAAAHRRAAFEACDQLMDYLKSRAPFWKKSVGPDGAVWVEPTAQDLSDAARWD